MNLTLATVATLVSGLMLLGLAFLRGMGTKDRLTAVVAGLLITAYALWGITRNSGTFVYGWYSFVIPVVVIGGLVTKTLMGRSSAVVTVPDVVPSASASAATAVEPMAPLTTSPSAMSWPASPPVDASAWTPQPSVAGGEALSAPDVVASSPPATVPGGSQPSAADFTVLRDLRRPPHSPEPAGAGPHGAAFCSACGHALRGTPTPPSCPRCGAPVAVTPSPTGLA